MLNEIDVENQGNDTFAFAKNNSIMAEMKSPDYSVDDYLYLFEQYADDARRHLHQIRELQEELTPIAPPMSFTDWLVLYELLPSECKQRLA